MARALRRFFGRVKEQSHDGSDLDLVIISEGEPLTASQLYALREAFSESDIPILIDILDWNTIPDAFKQEINKEHVVVQSRK